MTYQVLFRCADNCVNNNNNLVVTLQLYANFKKIAAYCAVYILFGIFQRR